MSILGVCTMAFMVFFAELRLMDELKDYSKDCIAHPERPLPRGILSTLEAQTAIFCLFVGMLIIGFSIGVFFSQLAGSLYLSLTFYLWLMYKEFYLGSKLSDFPLAYAISHQIVLIPLCLFSVAIHSKTCHLNLVALELLEPSASLAYVFTVLGSFFAYEICRKLNPKSHPILQTYLKYYGKKKTSLLILSAILMAALGAYGFGAQMILWPIELVLFLSLAFIFLLPHRFQWIETLATVSLAVHIWSVPIQSILKSTSIFSSLRGN
jgi:4-hydroxybenzoate polyprenyltransferase